VGAQLEVGGEAVGGFPGYGAEARARGSNLSSNSGHLSSLHENQKATRPEHQGMRNSRVSSRRSGGTWWDRL